MWASTVWPPSTWIRNFVLARVSTTVPSRTMASSLGTTTPVAGGRAARTLPRCVPASRADAPHSGGRILGGFAPNVQAARRPARRTAAAAALRTGAVAAARRFRGQRGAAGRGSRAARRVGTAPRRWREPPRSRRILARMGASATRFGADYYRRYYDDPATRVADR